MKKYLLIIFLGVFCFQSYAQDILEVQYEYDAAGNRLVRKVIVLEDNSGRKSAKNNKQPNDLNEDPYFIDKLDDISLKIFPNPTNSFINIEIENADTKISGIVNIYNTSGSRIYADNIHTTNKRIDLSNYPDGIYLINITINGKETTWKVIKK